MSLDIKQMGEPDMEKIIMDQGDNPFKSRAAAKKAMETMGLGENYKVVPVAGGDGFALMLKTNETPAQPKTKKDEHLRRVRVHRLNVSPENKNLPIFVCVNNTSNRKLFQPGEEVELSGGQIDALKNSVEEIFFEIPAESGIYESSNPLSVAKNQYPTLTAKRDSTTGLINMTSYSPNYMIEPVL